MTQPDPWSPTQSTQTMPDGPGESFEAYRAKLTPGLTKGEKSVLFHTLGLDYGTNDFRNMFLAGDGHHDMPHILGLVAKGLMIEHGRANQGTYYNATIAGRKLAVTMRLSEEPKMTRSKARYKRCLDCDSSMTFHQWLVHPMGAKAYGL